LWLKIPLKNKAKLVRIIIIIKINKMEPLIHLFSKNKSMPSELIESDNSKVIYNPITQLSTFQMGAYTSSSERSTDGTGHKNEADRVMDDN